MITITSEKLNRIYLTLNRKTKTGEISTLENYNVEHDSNFIKFVFRKNIGRKGAWQPTTNIKVIHEDDEDPGL